MFQIFILTSTTRIPVMILILTMIGFFTHQIFMIFFFIHQNFQILHLPRLQQSFLLVFIWGTYQQLLWKIEQMLLLFASFFSFYIQMGNLEAWCSWVKKPKKEKEEERGNYFTEMIFIPHFFDTSTIFLVLQCTFMCNLFH